MKKALCPKCDYEQFCPCKHCQARIPSEKPWVYLAHDFVACGNCGLEKHMDWWESNYKWVEE